MVKRILLFLMALLAALVVAVAFQEADYAEKVQRDKALDELGMYFTVPDQAPANDPATFWPVLQRVAQEHDANVFRKANGWGMDDRPFTNYYVLLSSDATGFYDSFRLRDGHFLAAEETRQGAGYLSVAPGGGEGCVGTLDDLGRNDACAIYTMGAAFDTYPVAGTYVVEAGGPEAEDAFISSLADVLGSTGAPLDLTVDMESLQLMDVYSPEAGFAQMAVWLAFLAVLVMIVYRQLNESKRSAVLLLYGNSPLKTWFLITGRPVGVAMVALTAAGSLAALLVPGSTAEFAATVLVWLAGMGALLVAASLATVLLIRSISLHEALKNRKDTRALVVVNVAVKSALCLVLVYMGAAAIGYYKLIQEQKDTYRVWSDTTGYGVFYPYSIGEDAAESINSGTAEIVFDLYPALNADGALFIESTYFLPIALNDGTEYRSIKVNPNYLQEYPVLDTEGNPIVISEDEADWVVLVPESRRSEEEAMLEHWRWQRLGDEEVEPVWNADLSIFGRTVENPQYDQNIRIIWTADGQDVFSFNPEVFPENAGYIKDPIIEVVTLGNSAGFDRANVVSGSFGSSLEVKLIEGDTAKTYEHYLPLLQELHLDDNLRQIITLDDAVFTLMQGFEQELARQAFQMAMVFALFLVLVLQSVPLLFELDARRAAARRLYGYPFLLRQRKALVVFAGVWAGIFAAALAFNSALGWPGGGERQDVATLLAVAGVFLVVEALVSAGTLWFVERRRIVDVLKGEF